MSLWNEVKKVGGQIVAPFHDQIGKLEDMVPGIGDAKAAEKQNAANIAAAQKQMDFQERMSNSAYQRSMADMKKAGLNPMLAMSQGGASTPSGALPTINSETKSKLGEFAMNSALGIKGLQTAQQQANTAQQQAEANIDLSKVSAAKQVAETQRTQLETAIKKKELPAAQLQHDLTKKGSSVIKQMLDAVGNSAKSAKELFSPKGIKALKPNPKIVEPKKPLIY